MSSGTSARSPRGTEPVTFGAVKHIGRVSASQVVAAYRHDFMIRRAGIRWPDVPDAPDPSFLCILRLDVLLRSGRPAFLPLEAVWDLYETTIDELGEVRSMWGDYAWTLRSLASRVERGAHPLDADVQERIGRLRDDVRTGKIEAGLFVAVRAAVLGLPIDAANDDLLLIDGHHRYLAFDREGRLPPTCQVLVGSRPVPLAWRY